MKFVSKENAINQGCVFRRSIALLLSFLLVLTLLPQKTAALTAAELQELHAEQIWKSFDSLDDSFQIEKSSLSSLQYAVEQANVPFGMFAASRGVSANDLQNAYLVIPLRMPYFLTQTVKVDLGYHIAQKGDSISRIQNMKVEYDPNDSVVGGTTVTIGSGQERFSLRINEQSGPIVSYVKVEGVSIAGRGAVEIYIRLELLGMGGVQVQDTIYDGESKKGFVGTPTLLVSDQQGDLTDQDIQIQYRDSEGQILTELPRDVGHYTVEFLLPDGAGALFVLHSMMFRILAAPEAQYQAEPDGPWIQTTFTDAVEQVYEGGTVQLLQDVPIDNATVLLQKDATITSVDPANPCTIYSEVDNHSYMLCAAADITLRDIIIDGGREQGYDAHRAMIAVGGANVPGSLLLLKGAKLQNNENNTKRGVGGAVCVIWGSCVVDGATITGNEAFHGGGIGMVVSPGEEDTNTLLLRTGSIVKNAAEGDNDGGNGRGGGVAILGGTFTMTGGEIAENEIDSRWALGGGVFMQEGLFLLKGGTIRDNRCVFINTSQINPTTTTGGGVGLIGGRMEMSGGTITRNTANMGAGVSVEVEGTECLMTGGAITYNETQMLSTLIGNGGGVYVQDCFFRMEGGEIAYNKVDGTKAGGGGLSLSSGTVEIAGGEIHHNESAYTGGGIHGSFINKAELDYAYMKISGGVIRDNTAKYGGGGYINPEQTLIFTGGYITGNSATAYGGGMVITPYSLTVLSDSPKAFGNSSSEESTDGGIYYEGYIPTGDCPNVQIGQLKPEAHVNWFTWMADAFLDTPYCNGWMLIATPLTGEPAVMPSDLRQNEYIDEEYVLVLKENNMWLTRPSDQPAALVVTPKEQTIVQGESCALDAILTPEDQSVILTWESSDENIAEVVHGEVTGVSPGTVTITVSTENGLQDTATIRVLGKYTVSYDLADGIAPDGTDYADETAIENQTITVKPAPNRDGYTFMGWSDGSVSYQPGDEITITGDLTLTAQWTPSQSQQPDPPVPDRPNIPVTPGKPDAPIPQPGDGEVEDAPAAGDEPDDGVPDVFTDLHFAYIVGVDDGHVYPNARITRAEVAMIFYRLLNEETRARYETDKHSFPDIPEGAWYETAAATLAAMGILQGDEDGCFCPGNAITRGEFAAIAARFDPEAQPGDMTFTDIAGHWAEQEILAAAGRGWILGYEGKFRPGDYITRAEAMTMVNRVLRRNPESEADLLSGMKKWPDNRDPDKWYYLAVQEATNGHDYTRKANGSERWTSLNDAPVH